MPAGWCTSGNKVSGGSQVLIPQGLPTLRDATQAFVHDAVVPSSVYIVVPICDSDGAITFPALPRLQLRPEPRGNLTH